MAYGTINTDKLVGSSGGTINPDSSVFRNRIINGAMVIDQRNAGASVTPTTDVYTLDRWKAQVSQSSKFSVQQNAGSVTLPVGFTNYLGITSLSAYTILTGDYFFLSQKIEGFNVGDLAWGTASASAVTLSFKVYSSLTGTFGGVLRNNAGNYNYPFSYTVSSANTWTNISVTIAGPTSGTWVTNNGMGIELDFSIGMGSTYGSGTAGAWTTSNYYAPTGSVNVVSTNGATFYITGVQLEKGSTATSFDYRPYGAELVLCQRYCQKSYNYATVPGSNASSSGDFLLFGGWGSANAAKVFYAEHKVPLRPGTQTLSFWDVVGNASKISTYDTGFSRTDNVNANGGNNITENRHFTAPGTTTVNGWAWAYLVTSEL